MQLIPLAPFFGVEVVGVDLSAADLDEIGPELVDAYEQSSLILVRGQRLSPERHVDVARLFGPVLEERGSTVGYVSNVRSDGITPDGALRSTAISEPVTPSNQT